MMSLPVPPPWLPGAEMKSEDPIDRSRLKRYFKSFMHVLSGLFIIGIGIFLFVVNVGSPYKEISGHVLLDTPANSQNGPSSTSYVRMSTDPNDLFILDANALHPTWNGQFFKNERVDVYYSSAMPYRIGALQMYDLSGRPTTKFTTTDYTNSLNASPISNVGLDSGVLLVLLGVSYLFCWAAIFIKGNLRQSPVGAVSKE